MNGSNGRSSTNYNRGTTVTSIDIHFHTRQLRDLNGLLDMTETDDALRTRLGRTFEPPVDVMLDPSLLVSERALGRIRDADVLEAQTQATLDRIPSAPSTGDLWVPATFVERISSAERPDLRSSTFWSFYQGQATASKVGSITETLETNEIERYAEDARDGRVEPSAGIEDTEDSALSAMLEETYSFLASQGVLLSRTGRSLDVLRDGGVPVIDLGDADLNDETATVLTDIGYRNPASIAAFGLHNVDRTVDSLVGSLLAESSDLLVYRVGQ